MLKIKPYLTRPFLPDARQFWLSLPLVLFSVPQFLVRPFMPWDGFIPTVCLCFAFVFGFNAVLDVPRQSEPMRGLLVLWFLLLLVIVPFALWTVFNSALWAMYHPMPNGGYGAR